MPVVAGYEDQFMKKIRWKIAGWLLLPLGVCAQSYTIDWHKIAGGGADTNGQYSLNGTIGQHDASATATSGNYSLTGGFWALYAIQTPGAPLLSIFASGPNSVVVAWPASAGGFTLQMNPDIATTNWLGGKNIPMGTNSQ